MSAGVLQYAVAGHVRSNWRWLASVGWDGVISTIPKKTPDTRDTERWVRDCQRMICRCAFCSPFFIFALRPPCLFHSFPAPRSALAGYSRRAGGKPDQGVAEARAHLGKLAEARGRHAEAEEHFTQAAVLSRQVGAGLVCMCDWPGDGVCRCC